MTKQRSGNFFEDFRLGQRFSHATPRTLTAADQSLYIALTGSRACLHSADTAAILAFTTLSMVPALLFFLAAQRRIVGGLSGAVKG